MSKFVPVGSDRWIGFAIVVYILLICIQEASTSTLSQREESQGPACSLNKWRKFKEEYSRDYSENSDEDRSRLSIFCENLQRILEHNANPNNTYKMGLNFMSDKTSEEMRNFIGIRPTSIMNMSNLEPSINHLNKLIPEMNVEPPEEVDWSLDPTRVSPARSQGYCGSCWAFATVGMLEGQQKPGQGEKLVELSEQNLLDCDKIDLGCEGGWSNKALEEIKRFGGLMSREDYPYTSRWPHGVGKCKMDRDKAHKSTINLGETLMLTPGNEKLLKRVVASYGPVAVDIDASDELHAYESGVFYSKNCKGPVNHLVVVVGYGKDKETGLDYWKIKNSWSADWGMHGFALMSRNRNNNCWIASRAIISLPKAGVKVIEPRPVDN